MPLQAISAFYMSNRLDRFRKEMAAFEGAADPGRSLDRGHYVPHPSKSLADTIAGRIALRPTSTHLLIGGIGSGKTTELLVARDRINELPDTYAHYLDISLDADISQMKPGVLLAVAAVAISKLIPETDNEDIRRSVRTIHDLAYGSQSMIDRAEYESYYAEIYADYIVAEHKGIIPVRSETPKEIKELLEAIDVIKQAAAEKYGTIVLLLDGLDRLDEDEKFAGLMRDVKTLSKCGFGVVLVGPIQAAYGKYRQRLENTVTSFSYQPCFDVERDADARNFLAKILAVRASEGFIEPSAADSLIHYSGGMLRDLINLTQAAIEEAYLSGSDNLQPTHVDAAAQSLGRNKLLGLSESEIEIMERVAKEGKFIPKTDAELRLLVAGRILEYRYPETRHAVHPAIIPLIEKVPVSS